MTPAEWRYFKPRCDCRSEDRVCCMFGVDGTDHYLIHEVLGELVLDSFCLQNCVKVGCHELGHEVSKVISAFHVKIVESLRTCLPTEK